MDKRRLESFTDGVIAILITIMVLSLRVPEAADFAALRPMWPVFFTYLLSFVFLGIYWNNHHHMFQLMDSVTGGILWANMHLLFWLSLVPFTTAWMGQSGFAETPMAAYGVVLAAAAIAYYILAQLIMRNERAGRRLREAVGNDVKGIVSLLLYLVAIPLAFVKPIIPGLIYIAVAIIWLVPDRRIERRLIKEAEEGRRR
jgi:uncharacterized membrane protein